MVNKGMDLLDVQKMANMELLFCNLLVSKDLPIQLDMLYANAKSFGLYELSQIQ